MADQDFEKLTFATQGNEYSYHAEAARLLVGNEVEVINHTKFGNVVHDARLHAPGLGIIAYRTVAGTVDDSVKEIIGKRTSALAPIVARQDVPITLALIGSHEQSLEDLDRRGVHLLGQKAAVQQVRPWLHEHLPWIKAGNAEFRSESTSAVEEVIQRKDKNYIALGPTHAAKPMGGFVLGPNQINPAKSVTSFFALQRDPRVKLWPTAPEKTQPVTVIALMHPEGEGEMDKIVKVAEKAKIMAMRFTPFNPRTPTRHNPSLKKDGGILEIPHGYYDEQVTEFCARTNALNGNDGVGGPFDAKRLGEYWWEPSKVVDLATAIIAA